MLRLLRETWVATAVFVGLSRWSAESSYGWMDYWGPTVTALVLVPPVWRWFVMRNGQPRLGGAALAGATAGILIPTLAMTIRVAWWDAHPSPYSDGFGEGMGNFLVLLSFFLPALIGGPTGAGVGLLVAFLQRLWLGRRDDSGESDSRLVDGAIGGAMVATLAAPFVTIVAAIVLPKSILPLLPHGAVSFAILLVETWLVLIPVSALLGSKGVGRWRRIAARKPGPTTVPRGEGVTSH